MAIKTLTQNAAGAYDWVTSTGTGAPVYDVSATLVTPVLGVATATTINKVTITAPATGSTLTIADGKVLTVSNTLTFTGTDSSSVAFGAGGTAAYTGDNLSVFAATTSAQLAGVLSDETGSGVFVLATSPTLVTPVLGVATATSINGLTITATTGVLTMVNGSTLVTAGAYSVTLTSTASTAITLPTTGTLATLAGTETLTNKTLTAPIMSAPSVTDNISFATGVAHTVQSIDATGATPSYSVNLETGTTVSANSGDITLSTGAVATSGTSGFVILTTGGSTTLGDSGPIAVQSGGASTGDTGTATIQSGSTSTGDTGEVQVISGSATTGASGNIRFTPGTASSTKGAILNRGTVVKQFAAPTALTTTAAITATQLRVGYATANEGAAGAAEYTFPSGTAIDSEFNSLANDDCFDFTIINISTVAAEDITVLAGAGITLVGSVAVQSNDAATSKSTGTWRFRKTAANTFSAYRIG